MCFTGGEMKIRRRTQVIISFALIIILTACNLPFMAGGKSGEDNQPAGEPQIIIVEPGQEVPGQSDVSGEQNNNENVEVDPDPVGLQDGLGSLDSYKLQIQIKSHDEKGSINDMSTTIQRSVVDKAAYTILESTTFDPEDDEEVNEDYNETYAVDNATCTYDGEEYEYEEVSDQEKELRDIFSSMLDFIPLIEDPVFVAEETMNGIPCNHFSFKLSGIGDTSGSIATINEGNYWLAKDGQYIVRYSLKLEIRSGAEGTEGAEVNYLESYVDLTDVNVPVSVTLPPGCFTAATEE